MFGACRAACRGRSFAQHPSVQGSQLWGIANNEEALRPGGVVSHILPDDGSGGLQLCSPQAKVLHNGLSVRPGVVVLGVCCQAGSRVVQLLQGRLQAMSLMLGRKHCACPDQDEPLLPADRRAAAADQEHLASGQCEARQQSLDTTGCTSASEGHQPYLDEHRQHYSQHQPKCQSRLEAGRGWRLQELHHITSRQSSPTAWAWAAPRLKAKRRLWFQSW